MCQFNSLLTDTNTQILAHIDNDAIDANNVNDADDRGWLFCVA